MSCRAYFAIRNVAKLSAICLNTTFSCEACCTSKYILGELAHPRSNSTLPSSTRTVYSLIFAFFTLSHASFVRMSIADVFVVKRFSVFSPSVRRIRFCADQKRARKLRLAARFW